MSEATAKATAKEPEIEAGELHRLVPAHLSPLVAVVGVLVLSFWFNKATAVDAIDLAVAELGWSSWEPDPASSTKDLLARLTWGATALVYTVAWLASLSVLLGVVRESLADRSERLRSLAFGLALLLSAAVLVVGPRGNPLTVPAVRPMLEEAFLRMDIDVGSYLLHLFMGFGLSAAALLVVAASATLAFPASGKQGVEHLRDQTLRLRRVLYAGAAVLVTAVIQTGAMHRLPLPLVAPENGEIVQQISQGLSATMGTLWSLVLLAIYLPAAKILRDRALELARHATGVRLRSKQEAWLEEQGMETSLRQQVAHVTAVLSPFLTGGPLMAALNLLGS